MMVLVHPLDLLGFILAPQMTVEEFKSLWGLTSPFKVRRTICRAHREVLLLWSWALYPPNTAQPVPWEHPLPVRKVGRPGWQVHSPWTSPATTRTHSWAGICGWYLYPPTGAVCSLLLTWLEFNVLEINDLPLNFTPEGEESEVMLILLFFFLIQTFFTRVKAGKDSVDSL